jgi:hypothetical protein
MEAYVELLKVILRLSDWTIELSRVQAAADEAANIEAVYGQKRAVMCLGPTFLNLSIEDQRQTVVHELIHCHLQAATDVVRRTNDYALSEEGAEIAWIGFMGEVEYATDGLADAVAPFLPLPWGF